MSLIGAIISLITGLIAMVTAIVALAKTLHKNPHLLLAVRGILQHRWAKFALYAGAIGIAFVALGLGLVEFRHYRALREQKELATASGWLDEHIRYFTAIEFAGDKVLGSGSEKIEYIHPSQCKMQIQKTFRPDTSAQQLPNTYSARGIEYSEWFDLDLNYSKQPFPGETDFGGTKYPDVRITPEKGNVLWHNENREIQTQKITQHGEGSSPDYEVRLFFPNKDSAREVLSYVKQLIAVCHELDE